MKKNYFDDEKPKKKKRSAGKIFLIIILLLVAALASFVITVKILAPEYDFRELIPEKAASFVKEEIFNQTTTEAATPPQTTVTTTEKSLDYLEDKEFKFDAGKQGNLIGNLLNGGKVGTDFTYIYHIVDGKGIYRFAPNSESYSLIYQSPDKLSSINLRGDYIYFVNDENAKLYKLQKGTSKPKAVAENVRFAYVYDSLIYFITNSNTLCVMDVKELTPVTVYYSADSELNLVGISKKRIFFSVTDGSETEFLTIDNFARSPAVHFRENASQKHSNNYVMENGYLYCIQRDSESGEGHYIVRQKFGSNKTSELVKTESNICYPIADGNRLYYNDWSDNKLIMKELNMNSGAVKTMLKSSKLGDDDHAYIHHGGEYDFIIGDGVYSASSMLTSSTNVMKFKDGKWKY